MQELKGKSSKPQQKAEKEQKQAVVSQPGKQSVGKEKPVPTVQQPQKVDTKPKVDLRDSVLGNKI